MKEANALSFGKDRMELFDRLVVPEEDDRARAARELAEFCLQDQREHLEAMGGRVADGKAIKPEDEVCSLVKYSCKRLIRGMASGRGSARQGFGLALCEVLKAVDKLETKGILELVDKSLVIEGPGKPKGGEIRETLLGQVFVYACLLKAGRLATLKLKSTAISKLLDISSRKDYLAEVSFGVIIEALKSVTPEDFAILRKMTPKLETTLGADPGACRIEEFQLSLWIWTKFGKLDVGGSKGEGDRPPTFVSKDFSPREIFDENFLALLRPSLVQATSTHPRVHSVWYDLLGLIVPSFKKKEEDEESEISEPTYSYGTDHDANRNSLQAFWSTIVDQGLLQSSNERKYLAFELLKRLCPLLGAEDLQICLSEAILTCLKQNLKREDNYLHTSAKKCVRYLYSLMKRDTLSLETKSILSISLKQFGTWMKGAEVSFDSASQGGDNRAQLRVLRNMFYSSLAGEVAEGEDGEGYDAHLLKRQQEILNQICKICKSPSIDEAAAEETLKFLLTHSFHRFDSEDCQSVLDLPEENRDRIARNIKALPYTFNKYSFDSLVNVLASLYQRPKFSAAYDANMERLLKLQSDLTASDVATSSRKYTETTMGTLSDLEGCREAITDRLKGEEDPLVTEKLKALFVLTNHILVLQMGESEIDLSSHAKDIGVILDQAFGKKSGKRRKKRKVEADDDEVEWSDVLLDLLLSLLSLSNQLIRKTVEAVFSTFVPDITEAGLQNLVECLKQQKMDEDEDEDDDDEMDEEDEEEEDEEEEEEEDEEGEDEEEGMDVDSEGEDQDAAMFKLDAMIAEQFRLRRQMSKKRRQEEMEHYKMRVITLLGRYLKLSTPSQTLNLMDLVLAEVCSSEIESGKVLSTLEKTLKKSPGKIQISNPKDVNVERALGVLDKSVKYVAHINPKKRDRAPAVEHIAQYTLKVLAKLGPKGVGKKVQGKITDLYGAALDRFFVHQKKCILKREFFISAFKIMPEGLGGLRPKLTEYAASARNDFLKSKANELLKQLK